MIHELLLIPEYDMLRNEFRIQNQFLSFLFKFESDLSGTSDLSIWNDSVVETVFRLSFGQQVFLSVLRTNQNLREFL